jgi:hypothetical protein
MSLLFFIKNKKKIDNISLGRIKYSRVTSLAAGLEAHFISSKESSLEYCFPKPQI